jgi:imidazolonepropionase-like amidohydrolase
MRIALKHNNAKELKLDSLRGTIEPGKIANLVLLKKSPLESVDAYDSITTVFACETSSARNPRS